MALVCQGLDDRFTKQEQYLEESFVDLVMATVNGLADQIDGQKLTGGLASLGSHHTDSGIPLIPCTITSTSTTQGRLMLLWLVSIHPSLYPLKL